MFRRKVVGGFFGVNFLVSAVCFFMAALMGCAGPGQGKEGAAVSAMAVSSSPSGNSPVPVAVPLQGVQPQEEKKPSPTKPWQSVPVISIRETKHGWMPDFKTLAYLINFASGGQCDAVCYKTLENTYRIAYKIGPKKLFAKDEMAQWKQLQDDIEKEEWKTKPFGFDPNHARQLSILAARYLNNALYQPKK